MTKILYKKTNLKKSGLFNNGFYGQYIVMTFSPPEYCRLFAQKKAYQGGLTGTPGPPSPFPPPPPHSYAPVILVQFSDEDKLTLFEQRYLKPPLLERGVNRRTDRRILKIFLPGFRIQSEMLTDFWILQLQWNAASSIFWARILDFACNTNIFARISDSGRKFNIRADLVNKS